MALKLITDEQLGDIYANSVETYYSNLQVSRSIPLTHKRLFDIGVALGLQEPGLARERREFGRDLAGFLARWSLNCSQDFSIRTGGIEDEAFMAVTDAVFYKSKKETPFLEMLRRKFM